MKSNPYQDLLQRYIREWSNTSEKGQGHSQARARENIQEKETTTRTRLDLRMKMDSARWVIFGVKRQRVEFVGDVQENDDFENSPFGSSSLCVLLSTVQQSYDGFDGIAKLVEERF